MTGFEAVSADDQRLAIEIANRRAVVPLDDLLESPFRIACAAYLAVEESWPETENERVLAAAEAAIGTNAPDIDAALAIRAAMLDAWWVRDQENPRAWDRALAWATYATELRPEWLLGWLLLYDGHSYRAERDQALQAAKQTLHVLDPRLTYAEFLGSTEIVFTGRLGWTTEDAEELVARAVSAL